MANNYNAFAKTIASKSGTPFSRKVWGAILILFVLLWVSLCVIGAIFDRFHRERKQTRGRPHPSMYTSRSYSQGFGSPEYTRSLSGSSDEGSFDTGFAKNKKGKKVRFDL
ncbi:hypothetical protein TWF730_005859 [Orbilia blumenaviensis]|uniref:Uncharacterized protein n=1 Tax=Orbilia blumenaviensis TaxID=1796055 RepID=A0AAV9VMU0_9PEZI